MKKPGWSRVFLIVACTSIFLQSTAAFCAGPAEKESRVKFTLPPPDSEQTRTYLGLDAMKPFKVGDIRARIVVIELMNSLCLHCQANAPIMNDIYKTIQADSALADVRVIAIALADDKTRVETFKKQFKTIFPILLDENLEITGSMSGQGCPITMVVSTENAKVLFTHPGVLPDADKFVTQVKFVKQLEALEKENQ
ncbi:MAG: TlpA disulfide reductase family protein [Syntrophobacteraceae bacterium]|jgi:thiol-disulfide isomerase/thioredoxin